MQRKQARWSAVSLAIVTGAMGTSVMTVSNQPVLAQPNANEAPLAENPANRDRQRRQRRQRGQNGGNGMNQQRMMERLIEREMQNLEQLLGKPLTEEQKQQVRIAMTERETAMRAAREKYLDALAKSTGVARDELQQKLRQQRGMGGNRGNRANRNGAAQ